MGDYNYHNLAVVLPQIIGKTVARGVVIDAGYALQLRLVFSDGTELELFGRIDACHELHAWTGPPPGVKILADASGEPAFWADYDAQMELAKRQMVRAAMAPRPGRAPGLYTDEFLRAIAEHEASVLKAWAGRLGGAKRPPSDDDARAPADRGGAGNSSAGGARPGGKNGATARRIPRFLSGADENLKFALIVIPSAIATAVASWAGLDVAQRSIVHFSLALMHQITGLAAAVLWTALTLALFLAYIYVFLVLPLAAIERVRWAPGLKSALGLAVALAVPSGILWLGLATPHRPPPFRYLRVAYVSRNGKIAAMTDNSLWRVYHVNGGFGRPRPGQLVVTDMRGDGVCDSQAAPLAVEGTGQVGGYLCAKEMRYQGGPPDAPTSPPKVP